MDLNYSTINLFPVPIHQFDVNGFSEIQNELINYVYNMRYKDPVGHIISNRHGWQSKGFRLSDMNNLLHSTILKGLTSFPPIKKTTEMRASAWVNINYPNSYNVLHSHPNSHLSGVMWIKIPKDSGDLRFDSPHEFDGYVETSSYLKEVQENTSAAGSFVITPEEGRMVTFPASLRHDVSLNKSDEDRISISYNIRIDLTNK